MTPAVLKNISGISRPMTHAAMMTSVPLAFSPASHARAASETNAAP